MLTRFIKTQLVVFGVLTIIALLLLGVYFLRLPTLAGVGQYTLKADLPSSGGLYRTANVTYRGVTIGRVTAVEPTETGVRATMSIGDQFKIPADASANVHSVSAVGEQYLGRPSPEAPFQARSGRPWMPPTTASRPCRRTRSRFCSTKPPWP
jgi:phospholipid/cholesterol/gamma-HCH transport system substrate-binding protein